jgi:hypothetical protein
MPCAVRTAVPTQASGEGMQATASRSLGSWAQQAYPGEGMCILATYYVAGDLGRSGSGTTNGHGR